jgi:hypothetical protein
LQPDKAGIPTGLPRNPFGPLRGRDMRKTKSTLGWPQERFILKPIPNRLVDFSELKLAVLKENFDYREFYEKVKAEFTSYSTPIVKEKIQHPPEFHVVLRRVFDESKKTSPDFSRYCQIIDFDLEPVNVLLAARKVYHNEILDLLDPQKDLKNLHSSLPAKRAPHLEQDVLPRLFWGTPAVREITLSGPIARWAKEEPQGSPYQRIEPFERIYLVDLRKGMTQLRKEFERHIKKQLDIKNKTSDLETESAYGYKLWQVDDKRFRDEGWNQLKVWKLRSLPKSFPEIAAILRITEDLAKKRFRKAFELVLGKKYDKEIWKRHFPKERGQQELTRGIIEYGVDNALSNDSEVRVLIRDIGRICEICPDKVCYKNMRRAIYGNGSNSWDACPKVYQYLRLKA